LSKKPCEIDISLAARLKAGALTTVVPAKDKAAETVFKLTLKGGQPEIAVPDAEKMAKFEGS
tara:strand:+ start:405 stop:590 length:186 start_codon:yes stop_codon:yes gene_type:complete